MKGKKLFSKTEAKEIKRLIELKLISDPQTQKRIRDKIRSLGFYITDFTNKKRYTVTDFEKYTTIKK